MRPGILRDPLSGDLSDRIGAVAIGVFGFVYFAF
jgi:hypothetical protein